VKESFKISYAVNHDFYGVGTFPFSLGTEGVALSKVGEATLCKICQSKRSSFTNRDFRVKIAMNWGG